MSNLIVLPGHSRLWNLQYQKTVPCNNLCQSIFWDWLDQAQLFYLCPRLLLLGHLSSFSSTSDFLVPLGLKVRLLRVCRSPQLPCQILSYYRIYRPLENMPLCFVAPSSRVR